MGLSIVTSSLLGEVRHDGYILLDVQTGSSLLIRQNTANNLVSPDIFIGISVYKLYIGFIYRNTAPPLALMRFNTRTFFSKLLGMYLRAFLRLGGF